MPSVCQTLTNKIHYVRSRRPGQSRGLAPGRRHTCCRCGRRRMWTRAAASEGDQEAKGSLLPRCEEQRSLLCSPADSLPVSCPLALCSEQVCFELSSFFLCAAIDAQPLRRLPLAQIVPSHTQQSLLSQRACARQCISKYTATPHTHTHTYSRAAYLYSLSALMNL